MTLGYGSSLGNLISSITDSTTGIDRGAQQRPQQQHPAPDHEEEADFNERMTKVEAAYRAQFSALDASLSTMKSTSDFLTQQLASITS